MFKIISSIKEDLANARDHDPAARGDVENAIVYSGLHAIWAHRVAHWLWVPGSSPSVVAVHAVFDWY